MLSNTTSIHEFWRILNRKFDLMNNKRCFWHHYIQEGMSEEDFVDFREDLAALGQWPLVQCLSVILVAISAVS